MLGGEHTLTNCVNCVAPIDPKLNKCPYCGTSYEAMGVEVEVEVEREKITLYADDRIIAQLGELKTEISKASDDTHRLINKAVSAGIMTPSEARRILGLGRA